jgi:hypothetical protein
VVCPVFAVRFCDFERSANQGGAATQAKQNHEARDAGMHQRPDGSWRMWAKFGSLQGAQVNDVFAHFIQAEWDADWVEASERCGEGVSMSDLRRTVPQRRAAAMAAVSGAAASAPVMAGLGCRR